MVGGSGGGAQRVVGACRVPRSLRLWPGGGGRKARRGEVAVASRGWLATPERPSVAAVGRCTRGGRRACHAGAAKRRGGGSFTHPRRPRLRLAEDGKIQLSTSSPPLFVRRGGRIARVQLALAAYLSENEAMKHEVPVETRFFAPVAAHACIFSSSALLFCRDEAHLLLHPKNTKSYANAILSEQSFHTRIYPLYTQHLKQNE